MLLFLLLQKRLDQGEIRTRHRLVIDKKERGSGDAELRSRGFVFFDQLIDTSVLAGLEFHAIQFARHGLFVGLGPVFGAEDVTDFFFRLLMHTEGIEENVFCHILAAGKKLIGFPAERTVHPMR